MFLYFDKWMTVLTRCCNVLQTKCGPFTIDLLQMWNSSSKISQTATLCNTRARDQAQMKFYMGSLTRFSYF